jgi:hypothetical protein
MKHPAPEDPDLVYETGVHLGDGCLSHLPRHTYRYILSGNRLTEGSYYRDVLSPLIRSLYELNPRVYSYDNSVYLRIYSKELVLFKHYQLGLPIGSKRQLRLPSKILGLGSRPISNLLSGLYDAEGSVKVRHNDSGDYPRISMGLSSKEAISELKGLLHTCFGISSTAYRNEYFDSRY